MNGAGPPAAAGAGAQAQAGGPAAAATAATGTKTAATAAGAAAAADDATGRRTVHLVLPAGVDDPAAPSGGNTYDRRMCRELPRTGWRVRERTVAGDWPRPGAAARAELARVLRQPADGSIVLLDGIVACGAPEVVVPEARRLRLAVLVHLPLADETGLAPGQAAALDDRERSTLQAASAVVATSRWAARLLVERHDLDPGRVHVAAPGTDPAPPASGSGPGGVPRLLCVAAVTPRKAQHRLVEALASVADLPWECVCVGGLDQDPEYVTRLRELIAARGLDDRVRLPGPRGGAALEESYATADLLLLPSRAETYGMAVTEALARGIPVVATDVGGLPEAVGRAPDGSVPGALVSPDDPGALAAALRGWLGEPEVRRGWTASALRRRTALTGWDTTARELAAALEELLREHRRAAA